MNIKTTSYGFCPTQNKEYGISIEYLDTSTLSDFGRKIYQKAMWSCNFTKMNPDNCPLANNCPIYKKAPETTVG